MGRYRRKKGVPVGYRENWAYKGHWGEKKVRKGLWKLTFTATKRRRSQGMGSFGKGTKIKWKINGIQYATKLGPGRYQTKMIAYKRPLRVKVRKPKRKY